MKIIIITFMALIVSFGIWVSGTLACSIKGTPAIYWPNDHDIDIPVNARILVNCYWETCNDISIMVTDADNNRNIPVREVKITGNTNLIAYEPRESLSPFTKYMIKLSTNDYSEEISFTTGRTKDNEPPVIDLKSISVNIDWVEDHQEAEVTALGMCGPEEYTADEIKNSDWLRDFVTDSDYLPEHYHVTISTGNSPAVTDASKALTILKEVNVDGSETIINSDNLYIPRILAKDAGTSKTYRIQAEDVLGNVQPAQADITVNFNKANSSFTVKGSGNGEGGGEGKGSAGTGCSMSSLNTHGHDVIMSMIILMLPAMTFFAFGKRSLL